MALEACWRGELVGRASIAGRGNPAAKRGTLPDKDNCIRSIDQEALPGPKSCVMMVRSKSYTTVAKVPSLESTWAEYVDFVAPQFRGQFTLILAPTPGNDVSGMQRSWIESTTREQLNSSAPRQVLATDALQDD